MKILYIHQYFKTPQEPGGTRSYWLALKLIEKKHSVTMLTTSSSINKSIERKVIDGINVIYLKVPYDQKMSIIKRLQSFLSFMIKSTYYAFKEKQVDLIFATSTPLTIGFPALILKKIKKIPYVFEVRDLWPEVPIQMGGLKNKLAQKIAIWFEKSIYKNATHIVALSPGMANGVLKYEEKSKVSMIPNMAKVDFFWPRQKNLNLLEQLGLRKESFKIIHFGSLGLANGVQSILESAQIMKNENDVEFIFIGGGATEDEMKVKCKEKGLKNVYFLGRFPMTTTSEIVNLCDVSIVSFLDLPILYTNSPNKLFDSLSAGKPIIVNSSGWTKDLVEDNNCGFYVNPNKPQELVDTIHYLQANTKEVINKGINARNLALSKYDKSILTTKFVDLISKVNI